MLHSVCLFGRKRRFSKLHFFSIVNKKALIISIVKFYSDFVRGILTQAPWILILKKTEGYYIYWNIKLNIVEFRLIISIKELKIEALKQNNI